jgi:hypothetical protein
MVAITATSSATPTALLALGKARLEQARREADLAEANAQSLRSQADAAEIDAQKSQENVRNVATRNARSDTTYADQFRNSTSEVPKKTQDFLADMYSATSEKFAASGNALKTNPNAPPVVNAQGQSTGRIVNVSA